MSESDEADGANANSNKANSASAMEKVNYLCALSGAAAADLGAEMNTRGAKEMHLFGIFPAPA